MTLIMVIHQENSDQACSSPNLFHELKELELNPSYFPPLQGRRSDKYNHYVKKNKTNKKHQ